MAKYTVIADMGEKLVEKLQASLVPDIILHQNEIGLRSPSDKGDVSLGIFLYAIKECEEVRQSGMVNIHANKQAAAPMYLTLYYMMTAYSSGDLKFRLSQEERILGGVMQYFHDYPVIGIEELTDGRQGFDIRVEPVKMNLDEISKLWGLLNVPYKLSVFYRVSPVALDSNRIVQVSRVNEVDIRVKGMDGWME